MRKTAAKGRKLLFLAAALALVAAVLIPSAAEATRTLGPPNIAAIEAPRVTLETLETATGRDQIEPENRYRLFDDLGWPVHPLELLRVKKTASGVFDLGIECNVWQTGDLSQECSSPSFQGLWTDPTTGLSYARNRWYDARTASWLSEDPMGAVDSPNLYAFVGWGTHMRRDPMGLQGLTAGDLLSLRHHLNQVGIDPVDDIAAASERAVDRKVAQATELTALLPAGDELVADSLLYFAGQSANDVVDVLRMNEGLGDFFYGEGLGERSAGLLRDSGRVLVVAGLVAGTSSSGSRVMDKADDATRGLSGLWRRIKGWFKKEVDEVAPGGAVRPSETGTYGGLKARKRSHGETEVLHMDHQPSFAAQVKVKEEALGRPLTKTELSTLKKNTPAVASPRTIHQQTSPTYGGRNTPARIAEDAADLSEAAARDRKVFEEAMGGR